MGVAACSSATPTGPGASTVPIAAEFEGIWKLTYSLETCTGYRQCVHFLGDSQTVYLTLAKVGAGYEGVADLSTGARFIGRHVTVSGTPAEDGSLVLRGVRPPALPDDVEVEVESISLPASAPHGGLTAATVRHSERGLSNADFFGQSLRAGPVTSLERVGPLGSASLSGTWTGQIPADVCTATGWTHCYPMWGDTTYPVTFDLVQTGSTLSGEVQLGGSTLPVTGTMSGATVRLSGATPHPSSGVDVNYSLQADALVIDRVGRLTGSLAFVATYDWHDGRGQWKVEYPAIRLHSVARSLR